MFVLIFKDSYLRDRGTFFWIFIFPTLMFVIFTTIFGNLGKELTIEVGILGESEYFRRALDYMDLDVKLTEFKDLESLKRAVERGKVDVGVDLRNFDRNLAMSILSSGRYKTKVVMFSSNRDMSRLAFDIFRGVFENADLEILKGMGRVKNIDVEFVKPESRVQFENFYLTMGIVMALMGSGIFGTAFNTAEMKRAKILKRFIALPVSKTEILLNILGVHAVGSVLSVSIVVAVSYLLFEATIQPVAIPITLMGTALYTSMGFFFSMILKSREMTSIVANISYFFMMFTGNLFFDTSGSKLDILTRINPTTYLVDMLRSNHFTFSGVLLTSILTAIFLYSSVKTYSRGDVFA